VSVWSVNMDTSRTKSYCLIAQINKVKCGVIVWPQHIIFEVTHNNYMFVYTNVVFLSILNLRTIGTSRLLSVLWRKGPRGCNWPKMREKKPLSWPQCHNYIVYWLF
jgi:hypothetical protein